MLSIFRAVTLIIIGLDDAGKTTMVASLKGGNDVSCQNIKTLLESIYIKMKNHYYVDRK